MGKNMNLIFEIYSLEIPARMQIPAAEQFTELLKKKCELNKIKFNQAKFYSSTCRMTIYLDNIFIDSNSQEEKKGPKFGCSTQALEGFAKSCGANLHDLYKKIIDGNEYYFAKTSEDKTPVEAKLKIILEECCKDLSWPKSMRWDESNISWARPIINIACVLYDSQKSQIIPVKFGLLTANNISFGHKFMAKQQFEIKNIDDYLNKLEELFVIADAQKRKDIITAKLREIEKKYNIKLAHNPKLLDEVTNLVEFPVCLEGKVDSSFLSLPKEVLHLSMSSHQRYFTFENNDGSFSEHFAIISNIISSDESVIIAGNQKVLSARLYDAKFFFEIDLKTTLENQYLKLKNIIFHTKIGTLQEKTKRIQELSEFLYKKISGKNITDLSEGAKLCKADIPSHLVAEFPELQGIIGRYYAKAQGKSDVIQKIISDHYLPNARLGEMPSSVEAGIVSFADKLDTIASMFAIGQAPTSSKDPYALRRCAIGVIRLITYFNLKFDITDAINQACKLVSNFIDIDGNSLQNDIQDFINERFKFFLKEEGFSAEIISALPKSSNILSSYKIAETIKNTDITKIINSHNRIKNILSENLIKQPLNINLLELLEEKELNSKNIELSKKVNNLLLEEDYLEIISQLHELANMLDKFFDNVLVNDKIEDVKQNRLNLIQSALQIISKIYSPTN